MAKMTLDEVQTMIAAEKQDALSADEADKLSEERTKAMEYYLGDVSRDIPTVEGRSKAVSNDVADTIEGMMPSMMEIFASDDEIAKFNPVGPEDVQKAEQETDYINHIWAQKNRGFLVLYSFIKDALLSKLGVVKAWWEETESEERESYEGLTDEALGLLMEDPEVEIVEHSTYDAGYAPKPAGDDAPPADGEPAASIAPAPAGPSAY